MAESGLSGGEDQVWDWEVFLNVEDGRKRGGGCVVANAGDKFGENFED
jgi:hypothetical protein